MKLSTRFWWSVYTVMTLLSIYKISTVDNFDPSTNALHALYCVVTGISCLAVGYLALIITIGIIGLTIVKFNKWLDEAD